MSALYYNPGALALVAKPQLLLSGTVFRYERVGFANALGPGENLSDSRFALVPSLFAGEIHFEGLGENRIGYAFLTRQAAEFRVNERADITEGLQPSIPSLRFASAGFNTRPASGNTGSAEAGREKSERKSASG